MRPNSQFVPLVLFALGLNNVKAVTSDKITDVTLDILYDEMTPDGSQFYNNLCEIADKKGEPVYINSDHPSWKTSGFCEMNGPARIIFRRLQQHFGRELVFTRGNMIVFPHEKVLLARGKKPLAV
jgi:hypothetical protein